MNFAEAIRHHALSVPGHDALADPWRRLTYGELWEAVRRSAWTLRDKGVRRGDRIMAISQNRVELVVLYLATLHVGGVLAPVNYRLSGGEISQLIDIVDPALLVVEGELDVELTVNACELSEVSDGRVADDHRPAAATPEDANVILFTSGTTGAPKGATLTHGNVWATCANVAHHERFSSDERDYVLLPLYHTAGLHLQLTPTLYVGGFAFLAPAWESAGAAEKFVEHRISSTFLLPEQWRDVCNLLVNNPVEMRLPVTGGSPVPSDVLDAIEQSTGTPPAFIMGMTEVSPQVLFIDAPKMRKKNGTAGHPTIWSDVRVLGDDGQDLPPGEIGEMAFRGPLVMSGYWSGQPLDPLEYFRGGDLVRTDDDGYITIVDRKKDIIRSGGETVFSAEVERILLIHPAVREACVIGLPHPQWGEGVTAVVVMQQGHEISLQDLQNYCKQHIASYKKPVRLELVSELPRTATGKIRKPELRTRFTRTEGER